MGIIKVGVYHSFLKRLVKLRNQKKKNPDKKDTFLHISLYIMPKVKNIVLIHLLIHLIKIYFVFQGHLFLIYSFYFLNKKGDKKNTIDLCIHSQGFIFVRLITDRDKLIVCTIWFCFLITKNYIYFSKT